MQEETFHAVIKCLNNNNLEEYYLNSLDARSKISFQVSLFRILTRNYHGFGLIYALVLAFLVNFYCLINPGWQKELPGMLKKNLKSKRWYQSNPYNSSVVAVIKAVQARYKAEIFKSVSKDAFNTYKITLKNGVNLDIKPFELELVRKESGFIGEDNQDKEAAYLAYAAMAKHAQIKESFDSFEKAFHFLNQGVVPEYCAELLGYLEYTRYTEPIRGINDVIIAYNSSHAVCINHGFLDGHSEHLVFAGHDSMGKVLDRAIIII